jgi:ribosomal protein L11 methyltransferase
VPLLIGDDWAVCGVHEADAEIGALHRIVLHPHPHVYGFGEGEETRQHLQAIAERVEGGDRVVDVGTGTGILAIAAAKLGAQVVAFEEVEEYRELAQRNIDASEVTVELKARWPDDWDGSEFDYVLANLGNDPLMAEVGRMGGEVIGRG